MHSNEILFSAQWIWCYWNAALLKCTSFRILYVCYVRNFALRSLFNFSTRQTTYNRLRMTFPRYFNCKSWITIEAKKIIHTPSKHLWFYCINMHRSLIYCFGEKNEHQQQIYFVFHLVYVFCIAIVYFTITKKKS